MQSFALLSTASVGRAADVLVVRAACPPGCGSFEDYVTCSDESFSRLAQETATGNAPIELRDIA
jgi:hypothetical protein